jgi:Fic family protein
MREQAASVKFDNDAWNCYYQLVVRIIKMFQRGGGLIFETPPLSFEELGALDKIEQLRRDLRYYVAEPTRWLGSVRRVLSARAIQQSNSIEGYDVTVEDAVAALEGEEPMEADIENWHAVSGYRRAMTYVLQLAHDGFFEYSSHLVRSLHFMMTEYTLNASPGLWRPGPIWIRNDATGDIVYEGPDAEAIPALVDELVARLQASDETEPMVRAAMAHLNLVMIHPFRDGNGRMSRCLQTLVLAREQILAPELCSIEEYLGRNTQAYYRILGIVGEGHWNPENDASPWVRFCLEAHYVQAASVLRRIRESEQIWTELQAEIKRLKLPERAIAALFDAAIGLRIRNSSYRAVLDAWEEAVSNQVATTDLRAMVQAGLLEQRGRKRGTYYVAGDPLRDLYNRVRSTREAIDASSLFKLAA